ncbi:hypothetical protein [Scytonema sp. NUACC26]|uniref:hypothetical protein n=1 Tax=Scytonema sp. NUACC26 TaxID=3140176 RepID=UPI0034DCBC62
MHELIFVVAVLRERLKSFGQLVDLPWDLKINNSEFQDETCIVRAVKEFLQHRG